MKKLLFVLACVSNILFACNGLLKKKDKSTSDDKTLIADKTTVPGTLNGIQLYTDGDIKVSQAYLIYGDDETLVPNTNETNIGRPVQLVLMIDNGWKEDNGTFAIGASEKIETNTGAPVLSTDDLFQSYASMKAEYGNIIKLKAVITSMTKQYDYFLVSFKVWDKKGNGSITGNYKLYIK